MEDSAPPSSRAGADPAAPPTAAIYFRLKLGLIAALACLIVGALTIALALVVADMV